MSEEQGEKPAEDGEQAGAEEQQTPIPAEAGPVEQAQAEPSELEKAHAERDRIREQLLRTAADFDNYRKRTRKEIEEVRRRAIEETLRQMLPIVDNLERAAHAMVGVTEAAAVAEGVHMVLRGFEDIASRMGLKRVPTLGQRFDPTCHDAVQQTETDEHEPGSIVAEVVPGYYLGERLLRPALVVVAKPLTPPKEQEEGSSGDGGGSESKAG